MIKQSILRCIIVSTVIATVASFCTITVSTGSIRADDMDAAALREHGFEDAAQWSEAKAITQSRLSAIVHTFKYPGFWVFWFRGFMALFVSLLAGTVTVSVWNEKRGDRDQPFTINFSCGDHGRDSAAHTCPTPPTVQS